MRHPSIAEHGRGELRADETSRVSRDRSNTGRTSDRSSCRSPCRMSAVAVCCSSASCVSLNSRAFSMAMTAWSAKVCSNSTCCAENGPGFLRVTAITPMAVPLLISGEYNRLRNPRARAVSLKGSIAAVRCRGSPDLSSLRVKILSSGDRARETAFQQFVRSRVDRGEGRQMTHAADKPVHRRSRSRRSACRRWPQWPRTPAARPTANWR